MLRFINGSNIKYKNNTFIFGDFETIDMQIYLINDGLK